MTCSKCNAGKLRDIPRADDAVQPAGIERRIVFAPGKFWDDYVARYFTVEKGAQTPFHTHDWPHYILIMGGTCEAKIDGDVYRLEGGCWAHVPPGVEHNFTNTGEGPLEFVCIVPPEGDPAGKTKA
jgi:quercetin dioxygenase-like cupin family protein